MNISILGYGNLGRSIANGLKSFDNLKKLYVTKKDIENLRDKTEDKKCILSSDNLNAISNSSIIFLTVQPKQFKGLAKEIKSHINSDQIIVLDSGCVAEIGTHEELLKKNGVYKKLYEREF